MKKIRKLEILFDNGGGILLMTARYCHSYDSPQQAAQDVLAIFAGADPADWEGNEPEFRRAQDESDARYDLADLRAEMGSKEPLGDRAEPKPRRSQSGHSELEFLRVLTGRPHIDDELAEAVSQ